MVRMTLGLLVVAFGSSAMIMTLFLTLYSPKTLTNPQETTGLRVLFHLNGGGLLAEVWDCVRRHPKYCTGAGYLKFSRATRSAILLAALMIAINMIATIYFGIVL